MVSLNKVKSASKGAMRADEKSASPGYFTNADYIHANRKCVKLWAAKITGPDEEYIVKREFLPRHGYEGSYPKGVPLYSYGDLEPGDIVEINGGSWKNSYRFYGVYVGRKEIVEIDSRLRKVNRKNREEMFAKAAEIRGKYNI